MLPAASVPTSPDSGLISSPTGPPILRYSVEANGRFIHVEWPRGAALDDVLTGFLKLVRLVRTTGVKALVSDSNGYVGDWSELIPWLRYEFLPAAITAGLRYLADVLPLDPANSYSVLQWRDQTAGQLQHQVFTSLADARAWVMQEVGGSMKP